MAAIKTDEQLLEDYWSAQAQFGPLEVGPDEYLRSVREAERRSTPK